MTERCRWCGRDRSSFSEWEQQNLSDVWQRLCKPCARKRLNNPWNALLRMRKITETAATMGS